MGRWESAVGLWLLTAASGVEAGLASGCVLLLLLSVCVLRLGGRPVTVTWAEPKKEEDTSKVGG